VLIDHGELLLHVGRAPDAVPILESAERILAGLGAAAFQVRCHRLLTECGVAIDLARPDPLAALTPRQEAVALLVADNLTNKEIAAELIVGLKTVEYHLSQIFTRLDLHSRRDLADLVRRRRGVQLRP
jgi:DNA-binding NarL/FixJ family response regulator